MEMKRRWFRKKKALSVGSVSAAFTADQDGTKDVANRNSEIMKYFSGGTLLPKFIPEENGTPSHMTFDTSTFRSSKKLIKKDHDTVNIPTSHGYPQHSIARRSLSLGLLTSGPEESLDASENVTVVKMYSKTSHFLHGPKQASREALSGDIYPSSDKSTLQGATLPTRASELRAVDESDQKKGHSVKDIVISRDSQKYLKRDRCLHSNGMKVNTLPYRKECLKRNEILVSGINQTKVPQRFHSLSHIPQYNQKSFQRSNFSMGKMSSPLPCIQSKQKAVCRSPQTPTADSQRPSSFMVMHYKRLGVLNLLKHRLDLLEDKLGCRQDWNFTIDLGKMGESSSDPLEKKVRQ